MGDSPGKNLQGALRRLVTATVVLYLGLAGLGVLVEYRTHESREVIARVAIRTGEALCSFKTDIERQVKASEKFLKDHPDGIPGIPAPLIKQGIDNRKQTLASLKPLECPLQPLR